MSFSFDVLSSSLSAAALDVLEQVEDFGGCDLGNGSSGERFGQFFEIPAVGLNGAWGAALRFHVREIFHRDGAERVLCGELRGFFV